MLMQRWQIQPQLWRPWTVKWEVAGAPVDYPEALARMDAEVTAIAAGNAPERVWLLEHPPLYTAGTSASDGDLLDGGRFPVYRSGRGGQFTYHGPGQRVAYVMLDLKQRGSDIRAFVAALEDWIIASLAKTWRRRRKARRPCGRLGASPGPKPRGQDRRDRHQGTPLGQPSRHKPQCLPRPLPFRWHCSLRCTPARRYKP